MNFVPLFSINVLGFITLLVTTAIVRRVFDFDAAMLTFWIGILLLRRLPQSGAIK